MSLGKRLFTGEAAAACYTDNVNPFTGTSADGGVALYSLDYDASDESGNYDGTPTDLTFGVDGEINWGASFNGSSSYIQTTLSQNSDDIAVSFWLWADSVGSTRPIMMINNRNGVIVPYAYSTGSNSASGGSGQNPLINLTTLTTGWNHIVINMTNWASSYTNAAFGGYIDIEVFANGSSIGTFQNQPYGQSDGMRLGRSNGSYYFDGKIDQVRIFDKALSSSEVSTLYEETACVYTSTTDTVNYQGTNLAYYKLDGNALDETTNNYDGTEYNITYGFGRFGTAAVFNGASSYISLTDIPSSVSADISISAWINTNTLSGDRTIISLRENRLIEISINSGYSAGQRLEFKFYDNANRVINLNENLITVGNWHHVCLTAQAGGNMIAYFDGVAQGSPVAIGNVYVAGQGDTIGAYLSGAGGFFDGKIDQVRIYGLLLDATEVANLYNEKQAYITTNASDPFGDGNEVSFYEFENNSNDSTGSNNGTANNVTFTSGSGIIGTYSADFNGSSSYISVPHSSTFNWTNNKTLSVWVKFDVVGSLGGIVAKGSGSAPFGWVLYMSSTGKIQFVQFNSSDTGATLASTFTAVTDVWYHVCVTGDGATNKLYIDGSLNHSDSAVTATNESDALVLGRLYSDTSNYYHSGEIDQLRFFDRTLDGDEVFKLYAEVIN